MKRVCLFREGKGWLPLLCALQLCLLLAIPVHALASAMFSGINYCSVPPLPGAALNSNVLLLLDNSVSMLDLAYADRGGSCSKTTTRSCNQTSDCPASETCILRYYCYDESYSDTSSYGGNFSPGSFYAYDFSATRFVPVDSLPTSCVPGDGYCPARTGYLYLEMAQPAGAPNRTVKTFMARGNFLNWLSASKLDIEKQVLTGGKYQADSTGAGGSLIGETRGCNGKKFVKVAPDAPQVTFAVGGPIPAQPAFCSTISSSACTSVFEYLPSSGGGTRIEIYDRQYNKGPCTAAVIDWQTGNFTLAKSPPGFREDARNCIGGLTAVVTSTSGVQLQVASDHEIFVDVMSYSSNGTMDSTNAIKDVVNECGPDLKYLRSDQPVLIPRNAGDAVCGSGYTHILNNGNTSGFLGTYYNSGSGTIPSSPSTTPSLKEVSDFKVDLTKQLLTAPSFVALNAGTGINVPSFVPDIGIYNLGAPATTPSGASYLQANVSVSAPPTGVIQEFANYLNFGVMIFNYNGAASECTAENPAVRNGGIVLSDIACLNHCQNAGTDSGRECFVDADCSDLAGYKCQAMAILDGGKVKATVGSAIGDHTPGSGLIATIDGITAASWSPLAEAFYEAIGYFANRTDLRFQSGDFVTSAVRMSCQRNNVLIVSAGISSADRNPDVIKVVSNAVQKWVNDTDKMPASMTTTGSEALPIFKGSYNLDDLAWIARHKNITDPTYSKPIAYNKDYLTTSVIYTGAPCGNYNADGSCNTPCVSYNTDGTCKFTDESPPEKLMQLTAAKGGGTFVKPQNPAGLEQAFRTMLQDIAAGSSTDSSIVATGDGNGAVMLREQFYPGKSFDGETSASWIGELSSLWYYIDPFIGTAAGAGSTVREDTDGNDQLTLKGDRIVSYRYDADSNKTWAELTTDSNGDGVGEGTPVTEDPDQVKTLWRAGQLLWARDLAKSRRTIYTPALSGGMAVGGSGMMSFPDSADAVAPYLNLPSGDPDAGKKIVDFVQGVDAGDGSMRNRTVSIRTSDTTVDSHVWKLGDIMSSTPQVQSQVALGG